MNILPGWIFPTSKLEQRSALTSSTTVSEREKNWKEAYLVQYSHHQSFVLHSRPPKTTQNAPSSFVMPLQQLSFSRTKKIPKVLVLGEGLRTSAKKLVQQMMWNGSDKGFPMTKAYPGIQGVGAGIGFLVDQFEMNLIAVYKSKKKDFSVSRTMFF